MNCTVPVGVVTGAVVLRTVAVNTTGALREADPPEGETARVVDVAAAGAETT
jgi:hypothetical protein